MKATRLAMGVLAAVSASVIASPVQAAAPTLVADWQMNEPFGTTVMTDATGNHDGVVDPTGVTANGSNYHWQQRCPSCPPVAPERVIQVADSPELDIPDPAVRYALEFRYKTRGGYGNIMQKGQSDTVGGQIKVQLPQGHIQCLFKGSNGVRVGAGTGTLTYNDGLYHTVLCVHAATYVQVWVDGVRIQQKNGSTGPIDNARPFVIGGKLSCDQGRTTCDYFSGDIDWVTITRG